MKTGWTALQTFVPFVAMSCGLLAQTFEVASVKPRDPSADPAAAGCSGGPGTKDPILYRCVSTPIATLASFAYNVSFQDMLAPQGLDNTFSGYDIQAVVPAGATLDDLRIMVRNLLTERFHMKWHREMRDVVSYILSAPKPKLRQSSPSTVRGSLVGSNFTAKDAPRRIVARGITMQRLASLLMGQVQVRVVNETNLEGEYDFDLEFVPPQTTEPVDGPSVFSALSDLGLSLKSGKRIVNFLVIDSADRIPTPN